jgi:RNA polymerase sigma factor (sigma-70 family)
VRPELEDVWRREAPHVVTALVRRYGHFDDAEDATQEALLAASVQWPRDGLPNDPRAWLVRVASRRLIDQWRSDDARRRREGTEARLAVASPPVEMPDTDDTLWLLVLCCHPVLTKASRVALVLRAVGGLSTAEVSAGFLVPEATMAQRISRAKATLTAHGVTFRAPSPAELPLRLVAVRHAISLLYTEGHARSAGLTVTDAGITGEALRLARELHRMAPGDPENAGLLALLLLAQARAAARTDAAGDLVTLDSQDRSLWDQAMIREGVGLLERCLPVGQVGEFQLQAAIAAIHDEATTTKQTDWPQILELYRMLDAVASSTSVTIGLATATAEVLGPDAGLALLRDLNEERNHRVHAVRGHLHRRAGRETQAREAFATAARLCRNVPEQRYLNRQFMGQAALRATRTR